MVPLIGAKWMYSCLGGPPGGTLPIIAAEMLGDYALRASKSSVHFILTISRSILAPGVLEFSIP